VTIARFIPPDDSPPYLFTLLFSRLQRPENTFSPVPPLRKKRKYRKKRNQQGEEGRGTVARLPARAPYLVPLSAD